VLSLRSLSEWNFYVESIIYRNTLEAQGFSSQSDRVGESSSSIESKRKLSSSMDDPIEISASSSKMIRMDQNILRQSGFISSTAEKLNKILEATSTKQRIQAKDIKVNFSENGYVLNASSQCVLCRKVISLNVTKYGTSGDNFKRHLRIHLQSDQKTLKSEKKARLQTPKS
jgi:hypothetical protein